MNISSSRDRQNMMLAFFFLARDSRSEMGDIHVAPQKMQDLSFLDINQDVLDIK